MDGILIHGNRYFFMVVFHPSHGQKSTSRMYHFHGYIEYPWIFNGFATTSSTLFTTSPTLPAAATLIIIHHIIVRAGDPLTCFITSLSLDLLCLNSISCSMITLGPYNHCRDIWIVRGAILICSPVTSNRIIDLRLDTRTPTCRAPSLLISMVTMDWNLLTDTLLFSTIMKGNLGH